MNLNGQFLELEDEERGCGSVEEAGAYMGGAFGPGGKRKPWVWWLGEMWHDPASDSNQMIWCSLPARRQIEINPRETAYRGQAWEHDWGTGYGKGKESLGTFGLADHVGRDNYTPWSFMTECRNRGPNRRIQPSMAEKWAKDAPFAVLFSHSRIPIFRDQKHAEKFLDWADRNELVEPDKTICSGCGVIAYNDGDHCECGQSSDLLPYWGTWDPTWEREGFGTSTYDKYHGDDHPGLYVLAALESWKELDPARKSELAEQWEGVKPIEYQEAIYGSSWINAIHVVGNERDYRSQYQIDAGVLHSIVV